MDERTRSKGRRRERVQASAQHDGRRFKNPSGRGPGLEGNPLPLMGELFFGGNEREPKRPLPVVRPHDAWATSPDQLRVTWLGHSTVLLEMDGARVLTDPVFGPRSSPVGFAGPKRFHPVPAAIDELPPLDVVALSHDHYDHLCATTMRGLAKMDVPIVTPLGVGARLEAMGVAPTRIHELDWGEQADLGPVRLTATPSQHFSGRSLTDRDRTLWCSFVIESERHKVFFSGDTGLFDGMTDIGAAHGPFDLVMLEIGAFHEAWGAIHLGPENALTAFERLGGGTLLPVHWGTFNLALHAWDDPGETITALAVERDLRVLTPRLGQAFEPARTESTPAWWRGV